MGMSMDSLIVGSLLAAAAAYLIFGAVMRLRGKGPRCSGCGPEPAARRTNLTLGGRKIK